MKKKKSILYILLILLTACSAIYLSGIVKTLAEKKTNILTHAGFAARINTSYYNTLEEAVAVAADGDIIYILKDVELSEVIEIRNLTLLLTSEPEGGICTIKRGTEFKKFFNGYYEYDEMFFINGGHLTINNLIIDGGAVWNEHGENIGLVSSSVMIYVYYGKMTLKDTILQNNDNSADTPSEVYAGAVGVGIEADLIMEGSVIRNNRTGRSGGAVQNNGGNISLYDVIITKNTAYEGGAFYLWEGRLYIKDSEILRNIATDSSGGAAFSMGCDISIDNSRLSDNTAGLYGGGIFMHSGSLSMIDSELNGNSAGKNGGAVAASGMEEDSREFYIKDSKIIGNHSTGNGGGIYYDFPKKLELSGDVTITENSGGGVYLEDSRYPILLSDQLSGTERIGVIVNDRSYSVGDIVIEGSSLPEGALIEDFYHDGGNYCLNKSGKNLILGLTQTEYAARIDNSYFITLEDAVEASVNGDTIHLLKNVVQDRVLVLHNQVTIKSEYGGLYTIKRSGLNAYSVLEIMPDADAVLKDIIIDGGAEWDEAGSSGYLNSGLKSASALVAVHGRLTMESGSVLRNNDLNSMEYTGVYGGGVFVNLDAAFHMNSGEITRNAVGNKDGYGAGVFNIGVFEMRGGRISKNSLHALDNSGGAGIYNIGMLSIHEGEISGNTGSANGGGICSRKTFTMYGGRIYNNIATVKSNEDCGGGGVLIYGNGNIFTMEGGEISSNIAENDCGGGVSVCYGDFILKDGVIKDNIAEVSGGGVRVHYKYSEFKMTGGRISDNLAGHYGGGIYLTSGAQLNLMDGAVSSNHAASGGGIYNLESIINLRNASIKKNQAGVGGGITIDNGSLIMAGTVDMSGNKNGDIYLCKEKTPVIIKENITLVKPIGMLVSTDYTNGSTVIDGNSNSINASLEDFYYAGSEHKLSKNGYDIILDVNSHIEDENITEEDKQEDSELDEDISNEDKQESNEQEDNKQIEDNEEENKQEINNQEEPKLEDDNLVESDGEEGRFNKENHDNSTAVNKPDTDKSEDNNPGMEDQDGNGEITDDFSEIIADIDMDEFSKDYDLKEDSYEDKKQGDTEQDTIFLEELIDVNEPHLMNDGNISYENSIGMITDVDEEVIQTGYQNKLPIIKFLLVIGICMLSTIILYIKSQKQHD